MRSGSTGPASSIEPSTVASVQAVSTNAAPSTVHHSTAAAVKWASKSSSFAFAAWKDPRSTRCR